MLNSASENNFDRECDIQKKKKAESKYLHLHMLCVYQFHPNIVDPIRIYTAATYFFFDEHVAQNEANSIGIS